MLNKQVSSVLFSNLHVSCFLLHFSDYKVYLPTLD